MGYTVARRQPTFGSLGSAVVYFVEPLAFPLSALRLFIRHVAPTRGHGTGNRRRESDQRGQELHELSHLSPSPMVGRVSALVHLAVKSGRV